MIFGIKTTITCKKSVNRHDNKTSEPEAFEGIVCYFLATQWCSNLRFPEMSATGFAHTNFDAIKMFQYFRHFHVTKLRNVFSATQEISAKSKLLIFSAGA